MISVIFDGFEVPYTHIWPSKEEEKFDGALKYVANFRGKKIPVKIAIGEREAFGRHRKRVLIIVKDRVMSELAETDNYDKTGLLIGVLKKPKSEEGYKVGDTVPLELSQFTIAYHRDYIREGFDRIGIIFKSSDIDSMIRYGLVKAEMEGMI